MNHLCPVAHRDHAHLLTPTAATASLMDSDTIKVAFFVVMSKERHTTVMAETTITLDDGTEVAIGFLVVFGHRIAWLLAEC